MPDLIDSRSTSELLKAFSHPTRLAILQELVSGPKCVSDMEDLLPARQANISQHLSVLRHAQLVDYAQEGTQRCYYLCRRELVVDMLTLIHRNDPAITRTPTEIQEEKEGIAKAQARSKQTTKRSSTRRRK